MAKKKTKIRMIASKEDIKRVAYAIYQSAKANGDDLESPTECAKAALREMGYEVDQRAKPTQENGCLTESTN
jgi:hypothetical protein